MTDHAPLPRRIAWFAPWTWKRRWWVTAALLVFVAYPLSYGPAFGLYSAGLLSEDLVLWFYHPVWVLINESPDFAELVQWYQWLFVF